MFLRRFARPLMMMANVKETTMGIVQSELPNARKVLIDLYSQTLDEIKGIPEDEECREAIESSTRYRLKVCQEEEDLEKIKKRIGSGQENELIDEAEKDFNLILNKRYKKLWWLASNLYRKPKYKAGPLEYSKVWDRFIIMSKQREAKAAAAVAAECPKKEALERAKREAEECAEMEALQSTLRKLRNEGQE